jgi:hypothetical protein
MHGRGHSVVADDIAVIDVGSRPPKVFPGFPQLKLWPDAVVALGDVPEALPQLHPLFEKRARRILRQFSQDPLPLRGLYVLGRAAAPSVEPLSPQEALGELMRHWYGHRFGRELLRLFGHASLFLHCANLANTIPVCRLDRPASLRTLPAVARLVEAHLAHDGLRAVARAPYVQRGRVERP